MTARWRAVVGLVAAVLAAGPACGGGSSSDEATPSTTRASTAATAGPATSAVTPRPGMPTVPSDARTIPRASTREAVVEGRPAVIVTLPETVLFDFGKADLRPDAEPSLQGVADLIGDHPGARAEVQGHTDGVGSAEVNQSLSEQRAASVADWLADHGVARDHVTSTGFGSTRPVSDNDTEAGRQANRRVEVVVRIG